MTFTDEMVAKLEAYLDSHHLRTGLGTKDEPCSIAAINLAISGQLTDEIPDCVSQVVGRWVIEIQDAMPDSMRNSKRWKMALVLLAGSGRGREKERFDMILSWMWSTVLPTILPIADEQGFGNEWRAMLEQKTAEAARAAARAAKAAGWTAAASEETAAAPRAAWAAARAAARATEEVASAEAAARAAEAAARAAEAAAEAAARATEEAARATEEAVASEEAAAWAARAAARATEEAARVWEKINPVRLLEQLVGHPNVPSTTDPARAG